MECVTQILCENHMANAGTILSVCDSHRGRWHIVSCECVNKSTIITFPHHLLQISMTDPGIHPQCWTETGNDSLEILPVARKVTHLKSDMSSLFFHCSTHDEMMMNDDKPPNSGGKSLGM